MITVAVSDEVICEGIGRSGSTSEKNVIWIHCIILEI